MSKKYKKRCFTCAACSFDCPNPGLYEIGEPQIKCSKCWYNSGECEDCLFEHSKECPEYKEGEE